jgi:hypothetical protein
MKQGDERGKENEGSLSRNIMLLDPGTANMVRRVLSKRQTESFTETQRRPARPSFRTTRKRAVNINAKIHSNLILPLA